MSVLHRVAAFDINVTRKLRENLVSFDSKATAILFGSRARKENHYHSDYDMVFVSEKFKGLTIEQRWSKVMGNIRPAGSQIELQAFCYTPNEWQEAQGSTFANEVKQDGIDIKGLL